MPDPRPLALNDDSGFGMELIRQRLSLPLRRSSTLESAVIAVAPEVEHPVQRRAAVSVILRGPEPEILFIRRAEHPNDPWSGHMAFPGGREEPGDGTLLNTAIRETREELSLDLEASARLIGRLDELPAVARGKRTGLTISPYVFEVLEGSETTLRGNYEVAETVWTPLEPLFRGQSATKFPYELAGNRVELPAHDVGGRIVWGLTHRMLEMLFAQLR
ncbi:MAG TPA: CoA pyrophosphatase [Polyangiales bacterium]|nr:CoA pyrophosphatase [Polyangiales bacterium]